MSKNVLIATVVGFIAAAASIIAPVAIVSHHSTERMTACVESRGQYLQVPERTTMECRR